MKKQAKSEKIRRAMAIAVAGMMVMGTPMAVNAADGKEGEATENHNSSDDSSSKDNGGSGETQESTHESTAETHSASEKAASAASESEKSASSAETSSSEAESKSKAAEDAADSAKAAAEKVNDNDNNKKTDIAEAAKSAQDAIESAEKEVSQKSSDSAKADAGEEKRADVAEDSTEAIKDSAAEESAAAAEESKDTIEKLCKDIEDNYDLIFSDDETISKEERDEAAAKVIDNVNALKENLKTAQNSEATAKDNLNTAEARLAAAKNNYDINAIIYHQATLGEWDETIQSFGEGTRYDSADEAKSALRAKTGLTEIPADWLSLIETNYAPDQEDTVIETIRNAEAAINAAGDIIDTALGDYNAAKADYEKAVDEAKDAKDAAIEAANKAKKMYDIAEEAAQVVTDKGSESELDNIYAAQIKTAEAVIASRAAAEEAVEAVKKAEAEREAVEDALAEEVQKSLDQLDDAKKRLEKLKESTAAYRTPLAFEKMVLEITEAQKAVAEAQNAYQKALANQAKYQNYAKYAAYYNGTESDKWTYISDRKISVYAQIGSDGKWLDSNKGLDVRDIDVKSQSKKKFTMISSDLKSVEVPDSIYRVYLKALADSKLKLTAGTGIATGKNVSDDCMQLIGAGEATMPVIYWEIKDDKLTGRYYSDITYQPTGDYFVGYVFKRESNMSGEGYHIDGVVIHHDKEDRPDGGIPYIPGDWDPEPKTPVKPPETPSTRNTNQGGGNSSGGRSSGGNAGTTVPVVTIDDNPVSLSDMIDRAAIEILDAPVALAASVPGEVVIGGEDVPLADSVPQTGDSAVSVFPVMLSGVAALGAAFGFGKKKKEK